MKRIFQYIRLFAAVTSIGCNKLVDVDPPTDRIERALVFTSDATAVSAMSGVYAQMIRSNMQYASSATTIYAGLSSDELYPTTSVATTDEYFLNNLTAGNGTLRTNVWIPAYQVIFQCNNIIEGLQVSTDVSAALSRQLEGEAKFIRAFTHFYLVNFFGDVPLVITTDYKETSKLPREQTSKVYDQIVKDLSEARTLLAAGYPSANRVRVNSKAASALLARVYMYMGEWQKAADESSNVISDPTYAMVNVLNNVFLINSTETIWQLMPTSTTTNTWEGNTFIPAASTAPAYGLTTSLVNAFPAADARKSNWTKSVVVGTTTHYYPNKYKVKTATTLTEYYVVLRLAEQYLIRAEAYAYLNKITEAKNDLNVIRARATLAATAANDQNSLLAAIEKERQLELFAEWGHRWFDLKRTGRTTAVLGPLKAGWVATDTLYPIPQIEINRNPLLNQNPGY